MYVDDALVGSTKFEEALRLQDDNIRFMQKGGFTLRKWSSNHHSILDSLPEDHLCIPLRFDSP